MQGSMKNRDFRPISRIVSEIIQDRAIVILWKANIRETAPCFRMVPFPVTLMTPNPDFKVTPLFDAECLRNSTTYRHSYNGILTGTYALLSEIFNDSKHRAVSLRQLSFLLPPPRRLCDLALLVILSVCLSVSRFSLPLATAQYGIYLHFSYSHQPIFTILGKTEMNDNNRRMNPLHFGSDPADLWIQIRINSEIRIRIPDHFWLRLDTLAEVWALWVQSSVFF